MADNEARHSKFTAYLCYFMGGIWGLHHIYLRRPDHAFLVAATFCGYFFIGLIRDLWKLPDYVKEANNDPEYCKRFERPLLTLKERATSASYPRQLGIIVMSNVGAHLLVFAVPGQYLNEDGVKTIQGSLIERLLIPVGASVGTWLVGNVGREKVSFIRLFTACFAVTQVLALVATPMPAVVSLVSFVTHLLSKTNRKRGKNYSYLKTIAIYTAMCLIYLSLWSSWFYFNCTVDDQELGEKARCIDVLNEIKESSFAKELGQGLVELIELIKLKGFFELYRAIKAQLDLNDKPDALKVFELGEDATPEDIVAQYRILARKYHPDRERDPELKHEMHDKFIKLQQAYKILDPKMARRKSRQPVKEDSSRFDL